MHALAAVEDFQGAAAIRDELSRESLDDDARVLCTIREFYEAFSTRDLQRVEALWLKAPNVKCLHPDSDWSVGYTEVCKSWAKLFKDRWSRRGNFSAEDVQLHVRGAAATVTCRERLVAHNGKSLHSYDATNILRKVGRSWFLVHRHVSPTEEEKHKSNIVHSALWGAFNVLDSESEEESSDEEQEAVHHVVTVQQDDTAELEEEDEEEDYIADTRDTVRALRRLCSEQRLPAKARLLLLSEIINNPGDSAAEKAYELLLRDVPREEADAAWEDFAGLMSLEADRLREASWRPDSDRGMLPQR